MKFDHGTGVKHLEINNDYSSHLQVSWRFLHQNHPTLMPQQNKKVKANVTRLDPSKENPSVFKRCGQCGDKKPQCRKQKKCLKDLL